MTKQEFEERVQMTVSIDEYEAIEVVYMQSDFDKDEFCKVWAKMNRSRIKAAIEAKKYREQEAEKRHSIWELYNKLCQVKYDTSLKAAVDVLTKKDIKVCSFVGLELENCHYNLSIESVRWSLYKFLNK